MCLLHLIFGLKSKEVEKRFWSVGSSHLATGLSCDGSVKGNPGPAGAVGLIRDENENWVVGFSLNLGVYNSFVTEQCAIFQGLEIAW